MTALSPVVGDLSSNSSTFPPRGPALGQVLPPPWITPLGFVQWLPVANTRIDVRTRLLDQAPGDLVKQQPPPLPSCLTTLP